MYIETKYFHSHGNIILMSRDQCVLFKYNQKLVDPLGISIDSVQYFQMALINYLNKIPKHKKVLNKSAKKNNRFALMNRDSYILSILTTIVNTCTVFTNLYFSSAI